MTDQLQPPKLNEQRYSSGDEIELMDYLLVIWRWKYWILGGAFRKNFGRD